MDFSDALQYVDQITIARRGDPLNENERTSLEAAWEDITYEEAAQRSGQCKRRLSSAAGRELFIFLTGVFGNGKPVTKKNFRRKIEALLSNPDGYRESLAEETETDSDSEILHQILGSEPLNTSTFFGRIRELKSLLEHVSTKRCILLTGIAGIGKSAIAAKLLRTLAAQPDSEFDRLIWKPAYECSTLESLIIDLIQLVSPGEGLRVPNDLQAKTTQLLELLNQQHCLIVLDALETYLYSISDMPEELNKFNIFLTRIVETRHQSCLMITSREPLKPFSQLQIAKRPIVSVQVEGLLPQDGAEVLRVQGLSGNQELEELSTLFRGNPLVLEVLAKLIQNFWGGDIQQFLRFQTTPEVSFIWRMLNQQFGDYRRLGQAEWQVMLYLEAALGESRSSISFQQMHEELKNDSNAPMSTSELIKAIENLQQRSLIEKSQNPQSGQPRYTLAPLIRKYVSMDRSRFFQKASCN
jgi:DNA-binding MarR family transcriptional regulator